MRSTISAGGSGIFKIWVPRLGYKASRKKYSAIKIDRKNKNSDPTYLMVVKSVSSIYGKVP